MTIADRWLLPDGMDEVLPPQASRMEELRRALLDLYHCWGYDQVMPPPVEFLDSLLTGTGTDLDLQTFKLTDQLTGRMMGAEEAERAGLIARIVEADKLMDEAMDAASVIAGMSRPAVLINKESVNRSFETTLAEGIRFERRMFHSTFAMEDQKEGMAAFAEKRKAEWKQR